MRGRNGGRQRRGGAGLREQQGRSGSDGGTARSFPKRSKTNVSAQSAVDAGLVRDATCDPHFAVADDGASDTHARKAINPRNR